MFAEDTRKDCVSEQKSSNVPSPLVQRITAPSLSAGDYWADNLLWLDKTQAQSRYIPGTAPWQVADLPRSSGLQVCTIAKWTLVCTIMQC